MPPRDIREVMGEDPELVLPPTYFITPDARERILSSEFSISIPDVSATSVYEATLVGEDHICFVPSAQDPHTHFPEAEW